MLIFVSLPLIVTPSTQMLIEIQYRPFVLRFGLSDLPARVYWILIRAHIRCILDISSLEYPNHLPWYSRYEANTELF